MEYPTKQEPVRFTGYDCSRPAGLHFHTLPLEEECIPVGKVTGAEEHSFKIWRLEPPQPLPARKCSLHRTSLLIHCPSDQLLILEPEGTSFHEIIPVTPEECNEYHETKEYRIRQFILPQLQETLRFQVGINQTFHLFYDSRGRVSWGDQPLQCPGSRWWSAKCQTFLPDHIQLVHDELVLEEDTLHHQGQEPLPIRLRSQKEGRMLGKLCEPSQLSCREKGVTWTWSRPVHDCRLSPLAYGRGQLFQFYHLGDWIRLIWDHGRGLPFLYKGRQEICGRTLMATEWPSLFLDLAGNVSDPKFQSSPERWTHEIPLQLAPFPVLQRLKRVWYNVDSHFHQASRYLQLACLQEHQADFRIKGQLQEGMKYARGIRRIRPSWFSLPAGEGWWTFQCQEREVQIRPGSTNALGLPVRLVQPSSVTPLFPLFLEPYTRILSTLPVTGCPASILFPAYWSESPSRFVSSTGLTSVVSGTPWVAPPWSRPPGSPDGRCRGSWFLKSLGSLEIPIRGVQDACLRASIPFPCSRGEAITATFPQSWMTSAGHWQFWVISLVCCMVYLGQALWIQIWKRSPSSSSPTRRSPSDRGLRSRIWSRNWSRENNWSGEGNEERPSELPSWMREPNRVLPMSHPTLRFTSYGYQGVVVTSVEGCECSDSRPTLVEHRELETALEELEQTLEDVENEE